MKVSILIPSFGGAEWEEQALRVAYPSALAQGAHEVLVRHEPDGNIASCRNALARDATGEWLCFLDADDELAPGYLAAMADALPGPGRWLLTPAVQYVRGRTRQRPKIWPAMDLRVGNYLVIGTLVQRDLFLQVEGFRPWPLYEDWCLWQRCWREGAQVVEVPSAVYVAHARHGSRNRAPKRAEKLRAHRMIVAANFPEGW